MAMKEEQLSTAAFKLEVVAAVEQYMECQTDVAKALIALMAMARSVVPADRFSESHMLRLARELQTVSDCDQFASLLYRIQWGDEDPDPVPAEYVRFPGFIAEGREYGALALWDHFQAAYMSSRLADLCEHFTEAAATSRRHNSTEDVVMARQIAVAVTEASNQSDIGKVTARRPPDLDAKDYDAAYEEMVKPTVAGAGLPVPKVLLSDYRASDRAFSIAACNTRAHVSAASPTTARMYNQADYPILKLTSKSHDSIPMVDLLGKSPGAVLDTLIASFDVNEAAARQSTAASYCGGVRRVSSGKVYPKARKYLYEMHAAFSKVSFQEALVRPARIQPFHGRPSYATRCIPAHILHRGHCPFDRAPCPCVSICICLLLHTLQLPKSCLAMMHRGGADAHVRYVT